MRAYERLLEYVKVDTTSSEESHRTPSSDGQLELAKMLCRELRELGIPEVTLTEQGYIYARLPRNAEGECNSIGFIAHLDTSDAASGKDVKPRLLNYGGTDILLNQEKQIYMTESEYPMLADYKGKQLIVTDGTTLLGADDKAGVAEIMSALEQIIASDAPHGDVWVAFTPDEEIGEGTKCFELSRFGADYAYTVDGGALGELEYENFNAATAKISVKGVSIHPGSAKDKMRNAAKMLYEFIAIIPYREAPEFTEGYEGFYHLCSMKGDCEYAEATYILRDHDRARLEERKAYMRRAVGNLSRVFGEGAFTLEIKDSYSNMRERIEPNMFIIHRAEEAMRSLGVEPRIVPIRGGTDGAALSFMGLPTPNLCTGGVNFHSRFEFACVEDMDKVTELIVRLVYSAYGQAKEKIAK